MKDATLEHLAISFGITSAIGEQATQILVPPSVDAAQEWVR